MLCLVPLKVYNHLETHSLALLLIQRLKKVDFFIIFLLN